MTTPPLFDAGLVRRYDRPGPRYTSYPSALQFSPAFGEGEYRDAVARSGADGRLSLYVHLPFCASPCYYCGCTRIITRKPEHTALYLQHLMTEIALQGALFGRRHVVEQLHLGGGTPTYLSLAQLDALMRVLRAHFRLTRGREREFSIEMDPRTATDATMAGLAVLGFNRVSLGIQDFAPEVQQAVNRVQSPQVAARLIDQARTAGFSSISVDLIYGLPLQRLTSFAETLHRVIDMRPDRIAAYSYAHLPERFKAQRRIRLEDLPTPALKLQLLELTVKKLTGAGYVYIGMDHFALPDDELARGQRAGTLQRNFQGYSTRAGLDLVGLGLSAIGKIGDSYAQNAKTLPGYYGPLAEGSLPVERGLRLSADDRVRAAAIEAVMCRGELDFAEFGARHGIAFDRYFASTLDRLEPLAQDRLIELDARTLRVLARGRLLLRTVALAFDAYAGGAASAHHSKLI